MTVVTIATAADQPLSHEAAAGHNRWHWDIPPVARCASGDELVLTTRDALDSQVTRASTAADIAAVDVGRIHPLTGPVWVDGAVPGDLLEVEVLEVIAGDYGFTSQRPGMGLLAGEVAEPYVVHWELTDGEARSEQLPGVTITGDPFLGIIGVAPSASLVTASIERESVSPKRPTEPTSAIPATERVRTEGLRTGPPRENGGNVDIKQLGASARLFLPVWQEGALVSVGDAHFAQGDGEVCGTAIEMSSVARLRVRVHRAGLDLTTWPMPYAVHTPRLVHPGPALTTMGHPPPGEPDRLKGAAASALRQLCTRLADAYGYPFPAAYALCSVTADLRVAQAVNEPNLGVTATLPLGVLDDGGARLGPWVDRPTT